MNAARRRSARGIRTVALVHRWLGLTLLVVVTTGTLVTMPLLETGGLLERFLGVFALEAAGGGVVNEPIVMALIVLVAGLGTTLLIRGLALSRGRARRPRGPEGWVRLAHRWLGAAFTVSLIAYLTLRIIGAAPGVVGWVWVWLLLAVNVVGITLFVLRLTVSRRATSRMVAAVRADP